VARATAWGVIVDLLLAIFGGLSVFAAAAYLIVRK